MTLMSYEIFKQIRGMQVRCVYLHHFILCHFLNKFNREYSRKKFLYYSQVIKMAQESDILRKKVPIGWDSHAWACEHLIFSRYGIPALICTLTLIVEATAPRCSSIRPRFGHKWCRDITKYWINDSLYFQDLPLLREAGQVHLALPSHSDSSSFQHCHVCLHHLRRLQKQAN